MKIKAKSVIICILAITLIIVLLSALHQVRLSQKYKNCKWIDVNSYVLANDFTVQEIVNVYILPDIDCGYEYRLFKNDDLKTPIKKLDAKKQIPDINMFNECDYIEGNKNQEEQWFFNSRKYYFTVCSDSAILYKADANKAVAGLVFGGAKDLNNWDFTVVYEEENSACYQIGPYLIYNIGDKFGQRYLDARSSAVYEKTSEEFAAVCDKIKKHNAQSKLRVTGISRFSVTKWLNEFTE